MKVTLVMLMTVDGKITYGEDGNVYTWSSSEDKKHFLKLKEKNNLIIMGRKTYEISKPKIKLKKGKLRMVITRNPEKYLKETVKGQLEFTAESPKQLINRFSKLGYKNILLTGGAKINSQFLKAKLVDDLILTVEPLIFGEGRNITEGQFFNLKLELLEIKKVNKRGTLILRYKFLK